MSLAITTIGLAIAWHCARHRARAHQYRSFSPRCVTETVAGVSAYRAGVISLKGSAKKKVSVDTLRLELESIERELALMQERVVALAEDERRAVERHDRVALDHAWAEHDGQLEQLHLLEGRREQARQDLLRTAELKMDEWRSKAQARVRQWQQDDQETTRRIVDGLVHIEQALGEVQERPHRHQEERARLLDELASLRLHDLASELPEVEIDWDIQALDLGTIAGRLVELASRCRAANATDRALHSDTWPQ